MKWRRHVLQLKTQQTTDNAREVGPGDGEEVADAWPELEAGGVDADCHVHGEEGGDVDCGSVHAVLPYICLVTSYLGHECMHVKKEEEARKGVEPCHPAGHE